MVFLLKKCLLNRIDLSVKILLKILVKDKWNFLRLFKFRVKVVNCLFLIFEW